MVKIYFHWRFVNAQIDVRISLLLFTVFFTSNMIFFLHKKPERKLLLMNPNKATMHCFLSTKGSVDVDNWKTINPRRWQLSPFFKGSTTCNDAGCTFFKIVTSLAYAIVCIHAFSGFYLIYIWSNDAVMKVQFEYVV